MLLFKDTQFLPKYSLRNSVKIRYDTHEYFVLTEFRNDCVKIEDFLIKVYFRITVCFLHHTLCSVSIDQKISIEVYPLYSSHEKYYFESDYCS